MLRSIAMISAVLAGTALPVRAQGYIEYPAPVPLPLPHSAPTGKPVLIAPYDHVFVVRGYATPPQQPFYNVPPHAAVAPY